MRVTVKQYAQALYAALQDAKAEEKTVLGNFVRELRKARMLRELPAILERVQQLHDTAQGITRIRLVVAKELSEHLTRELTSQLTADLGTTVVLHTEVDKAVLGGAALYIGDTKIDATAQAALAQIHERLTKS